MNYFANEPIYGYYCKFINMGYEYPVMVMHYGKIGKAKNGRTIGINEKGEITDIATASFVSKENFEKYFNCKQPFFSVMEYKARKAYKYLEDCGYIGEMRRIEEWGIITKQDLEWAGIKVDELN